jgi:hypothetical protein
MKNPFSSKSKATASDTVAPQAESSNDKDLSDVDLRETTTRSRSVQVHYDSYWNAHTTVHVKDSQQPTTDLYTIETRHRKPQMNFLSNGANVASADWPTFSSNISLTVRGHNIKLESHQLGRKYSYTSPTTGQQMMWRPRRKVDDLNMVLLNAQGLAIASYQPRYSASTRQGTLEILPESCGSGKLVEEVMIAALAIIHFKEAQRMAAAAS